MHIISWLIENYDGVAAERGSGHALVEDGLLIIMATLWLLKVAGVFK